MKNIIFKQQSDTPHWVGDGFPVRTMFTYQQKGEAFSPYLMMDYAGPAEFTPTKKPRGVGEHPHRGFETVTIVYSGGVVHRDSAGGGGKIGPGDVQWMTAASGLVHDELHSEEFSKSGGTFEMVQLGDEVLKSAEIAALDHSDDNFSLTAHADSNLLILVGAAINEPIVGHGPFVMNTTAEIHQAINDFNNGRMGKL